MAILIRIVSAILLALSLVADAGFLSAFAQDDADLHLSNDQVVALSMQKYKVRKMEPQKHCELFLEKAREIIGNGADADERKLLGQLSKALENRPTGGSFNSLITYLNSCAKKIELKQADSVDTVMHDADESAGAETDQSLDQIREELDEAMQSIDLHKRQIETLEARLKESDSLNSRLQDELTSASSAHSVMNDAMQKNEIEYEDRIRALEIELNKAKAELESVRHEKEEAQTRMVSLEESGRTLNGTLEKCNSERDEMQKERDQCQLELKNTRSDSSNSNSNSNDDSNDSNENSSSCCSSSGCKRNRCDDSDDEDNRPCSRPCYYRPCYRVRRYYY